MTLPQLCGEIIKHILLTREKSRLLFASLLCNNLGLLASALPRQLPFSWLFYLFATILAL